MSAWSPLPPLCAEQVVMFLEEVWLLTSSGLVLNQSSPATSLQAHSDWQLPAPHLPTQKTMGGTPGGGLTEGCESEPLHCLFSGARSRTSLSLSFPGQNLMGGNNMSSKAFLKSRPRSALGMDDEQDAGFLEGCLGLQPSQAQK